MKSTAQKKSMAQRRGQRRISMKRVTKTKQISLAESSYTVTSTFKIRTCNLVCNNLLFKSEPVPVPRNIRLESK